MPAAKGTWIVRAGKMSFVPQGGFSKASKSSEGRGAVSESLTQRCRGGGAGAGDRLPPRSVFDYESACGLKDPASKAVFEPSGPMEGRGRPATAGPMGAPRTGGTSEAELHVESELVDACTAEVEGLG